jgi:tetratricopeptide (TPR) repeat protein
MLGDLRDKLEPIGRLDALDGVGARVLQYYGKQDMSQLSDQGLAQRSKALTLMGRIALDKGDLDRADLLYRTAYAGTAEAIRRNPADPQRLFEHAQNAFYIGEIADKRGRVAAAESAFREYKRLANRMVALQPDDIRWRMEVQYAAANLGTVLYSKRNFRDAAQQFESALTTIQAFAAADPANPEYQVGVADSLALLADAQQADGRLGEAVETRRRHVTLLESLLPRHGAAARYRLVPGRRDLGGLFAIQGNQELARKEYLAAVSEGERLILLEPANTRWRESLLAAKLGLARIFMDGGEPARAASNLGSNCKDYEQFAAQQPGLTLRLVALRECLLLRAQIEAQSGGTVSAIRSASRAVEVARSVKTTDPVDDQFGLASALRIFGDIRARAGNSAGAKSAWMQAHSELPATAAEKPQEMHEHSLILRRLGRAREASIFNNRLAKMGYNRSPT